jgi:UPF0755 protein
MMERFLKYLLIILVLAHVILIFGYVYRGQQAVFATRQISESDRHFRIESGQSLRQVLEQLEAKNLAPAQHHVRLALISKDKQPVVKKGLYLLPEAASTWEILELFHEGEVQLFRLTIPEGLDKWETAELLGESRWGNYETFHALIENPDLIAAWDPDATDLEGYLFPETYMFPIDATPLEIVQTMVEQFLNHTKPLRHQLPESGLTLRQWVALASLIEKETGVPDERARIAGVFDKRLKRGMLLQCDPTIIYGLKLDGLYDGKIYRSQIRRDHPYNTYVYKGIPPGPIASPGLAALEATLTPEDNPYYYFVAKNDGSHYFSKTLREHNRAVRQYR